MKVPVAALSPQEERAIREELAAFLRYMFRLNGETKSMKPRPTRARKRDKPSHNGKH